jgi:large subunit ribosomal protein L28
MAICEMCGKKPQFGHNVSFSKRRTNRMWRPNIQTTTVMVEGRPKKVTVCARCLRTLSKE